MVRKWSYLNEAAFNLTNGSLDFFRDKHRFKVFRATTRFKKYNVGLTKAVRRLYIRRRRRANFIGLTYIAADWAKLFLRARQLYRFLQAYGSTPILLYSADSIVLNSRVSTVSTPGSLNSFACARKVLSLGAATSYLPKTHHLLTPYGSTTNAGILLLSDGDHEVASTLGPNVKNYDNITYPYDEEEVDNLGTDVLNAIVAASFQNTQAHSVAVYETLIYITLISSKM